MFQGREICISGRKLNTEMPIEFWLNNESQRFARFAQSVEVSRTINLQTGSAQSCHNAYRNYLFENCQVDLNWK